MSEHPNDEVIFAQYSDSGLRETYPPLPRRMGNPNAVAPEAVIAQVIARLPTPLPTILPQPILTDPDADPYVAAGWLG